MSEMSRKDTLWELTPFLKGFPAGSDGKEPASYVRTWV